MKKLLNTLLLVSCCLMLNSPEGHAEIFEEIDEALRFQSKNGYFQLDASGVIDLEGYYTDAPSPGLLFSDDEFFNPRLTLLLDAHVGSHWYSFIKARADRGFDPGLERDGEARLDEYFVRYQPLEDPSINLQAGKFATVFGNWVSRHDSWENPFITAPLPYEHMTAISDQSVPARDAFLARKDQPDNKAGWLPVLWGPSYAHGASVFGSVEKFDYAVEVKNASISSRPEAWDDLGLLWDGPIATSRIGFRPNASWNFGISASYGSFLLPEAEPFLPMNDHWEDYHQFTIGHDIGYSHGRWQFWAEVIGSQFEVPLAEEVETVAYYLEARYKLNPQWFLALRWNQQFFSEIEDSAGKNEHWDHETSRMDASCGYRFHRNMQIKLQYSLYLRKENDPQADQLVASQLTIKF